jgi:hypothetical protein
MRRNSKSALAPHQLLWVVELVGEKKKIGEQKAKDGARTVEARKESFGDIIGV